MKKLPLYALFVLALCAGAAFAQPSAQPSPAAKAADAKPKRVVFRANKDQIKQAQEKLKAQNLYTGEATGKLDPATRAALKAFQTANGLRAAGTLNRATLEKLSIELTDAQKAIPIPESSYASADKAEKSTAKRRIFRATKTQITEAQNILRSGSMYSGEASGKLDDATREGLKNYLEANGLKVTGTLNQATVEKMGIALTDSQKNAAAAAETK